MSNARICFSGSALFVAWLAALPARAAVIINPDFDSGTLSGWTTYNTVQGTAGNPSVVSFDTNGDAAASNAAQFQVGTVPGAGFGTARGGGIEQNVSVAQSGEYTLSVSVAAANGETAENIEGGRFELIWDGSVVSQWASGHIQKSATERELLSATMNVAAGAHTLRLQVTRPYEPSSSLFQYADHFQMAPVPEPTTAGLVLLGAAALALRRRR